MSEQGNIDLDAIEVEFDDHKEVCGVQNCETETPLPSSIF